MKKKIVTLTVILMFFAVASGLFKSDSIFANTRFVEEITQNQPQAVLEENEREKIIETFKKYDIPMETIEFLLAKLDNDQPLDSMLYTENQSISSRKIDTETGYETVYTFNDGSIIITTTEELDRVLSIPRRSPRSTTGIEGGTSSGGTGYVNFNNRKVYYNNVVWEISFRANYSMVQNGLDSISWVGNHSLWGAHITFSDIYLRTIRAKETSSNKAEARLSLYLTQGTSQIFQTRSVSLLVGNNTATARGNNYY